MRKKIEVGDTVNIYFNNNIELMNVEVLYTPAATGDSWRVRDKHGNLHYVQQFEVIELKKGGLNERD